MPCASWSRFSRRLQSVEGKAATCEKIAFLREVARLQWYAKVLGTLAGVFLGPLEPGGTSLFQLQGSDNSLKRST